MNTLHSRAWAAGLCALVLSTVTVDAQTKSRAPHQPVLRATSPAHHAAGAPFQWHSTMTIPHLATNKHDADQREEPTDLRAAPANNNCSGATLLTVGTSCAPVSGTVAQATQSIAAITCSSVVGNANDDVWYSFVATADAVTIRLECNESFDGVIDLREGACNGTNVDCADNFFAGGSESLNATGLTVGNTYFVRVYDFEAGFPTDPTFTICAFATPPPPVNDECTGAVVQSLAVPGSATVTGDNTGATDTEGFGVNTTWEAFTITECANVSVSYCGTAPGFQGETVLLQGCPDFSALVDSSSTQDCGDGNLQVNFDGLEAGTYFYPVVEVDGLIEGAYTLTFTATACGVVVGPPNDLCSAVTPVALDAGTSVNFTGDNTGATDTDDYEPGSILDVGGDTTTVWHAFTTTECTDIAVAYCGTAVPPSNYWAVLATSCPANDDLLFFSGGNFSDCGDDNATIFFTAVPAGTYYLPVRGEPATAGPYSIQVSAEACATPPANDDCAGAVMLSVHTTCEPTDGDVFGATGSMPAVECNGFEGDANDDVWYSFVATAVNHAIIVDATDTLDAVVELFEGDCSGLNSLACSDATLGGGVEQIDATDMVVGNTYYVRVYDWYSGYPIASTFTICVTGDLGTGVAEAAQDAFSVRPNPSNGNLTVHYNAPSANVTLDVLDMTGRVVTSMRRQLVNGQDVNLSLAGRLAEGNYVLRMTSVTDRSEQRIVVRY